MSVPNGTAAASAEFSSASVSGKSAGPENSPNFQSRSYYTFYLKPTSNYIFVCGHRPKTKALLELLLLFFLFSIWFISSLKGI